MRRGLPPFNVFVSYADTDQSLKDDIIVHLRGLERQGLILRFDRSLVLPGQDVSQEVERQMRTADIILILTSADYFDSPLCRDVELATAFVQHASNQATVVPVALRACDHGVPWLTKLEPLPARGEPIATWSGKCTSDRAVELTLQVASTLEHAHNLGVVHRDIKPHNILLTNNGEPRLTDFDLAASVDTTGGTRAAAMGTWGYSPREMMTDPRQADARTDIAGLAMTTLFCFYGQDLPHNIVHAAGRAALLRKLFPQNEPMRAVLRKATADEMKDRYHDIRSFSGAIQEAYFGDIQPAVDEGYESTETPHAKQWPAADFDAGDWEDQLRILQAAQERARKKHNLIESSKAKTKSNK